MQRGIKLMNCWFKTSPVQDMTQSSSQWIYIPLKMSSYHLRAVALIARESMDWIAKGRKLLWKPSTSLEPQKCEHTCQLRVEGFSPAGTAIRPWCRALTLSNTKFSLSDFNMIISTILNRFLSNFSMQAMKGFFSITQEQKVLIIKCLFNCLVVWLIQVTGHEVSEYLCF